MYFEAEQFEFEFVKELKPLGNDNVELLSQKNTHFKMGAMRNPLGKRINEWACSIREASVSKPVFRLDYCQDRKKRYNKSRKTSLLR